MDPSRHFNLTDTHIALIRAANWCWDGWSDVEFEESKLWPVVRIDAKRTYSFDLLRTSLGWEVAQDVQGHFQYTESQRSFVWRAHDRILPAPQVFVENAELAPGSYVLK
jgi:hypothetical protein